MNHWDRLQGQLRSQAPDCLPIALWRHWPEHDADSFALARAVMGWQRRHDFDLVRCMPSNTAAAEHWGATAREAGDDPFGLRRIERYAVTAPAHWAQLRPARPDVLACATQCAARLAEALGGTAPLLQSIQSPFATAWHLAGDAVFDHLASAPDLLAAGLRAIADVAADMARRAIEAGADGVALTQDCPGLGRLEAEQFGRFVRAWDEVVLEAVRGASQIDLLDVRDAALRFDRIAAYPVHVVSWAGFRAGPGAVAGAGAFGAIAAGGLDAAGALGSGSRADVEREACAAVERFAGARAMIASGGPCMLATPAVNIDAAVDAVRRRAS